MSWCLQLQMGETESEERGWTRVKGEVSGAWSGVLEGERRILRALAPYGMACSQTDAAGHGSLEQGTDEPG